MSHKLFPMGSFSTFFEVCESGYFTKIMFNNITLIVGISLDILSRTWKTTWRENAGKKKRIVACAPAHTFIEVVEQRVPARRSDTDISDINCKNKVFAFFKIFFPF